MLLILFFSSRIYALASCTALYPRPSASWPGYTFQGLAVGPGPRLPPQSQLLSPERPSPPTTHSAALMYGCRERASSRASTYHQTSLKRMNSLGTAVQRDEILVGEYPTPHRAWLQRHGGWQYQVLIRSLKWGPPQDITVDFRLHLSLISLANSGPGDP